MCQEKLIEKSLKYILKLGRSEASFSISRFASVVQVSFISAHIFFPKASLFFLSSLSY